MLEQRKEKQLREDVHRLEQENQALLAEGQTTRPSQPNPEGACPYDGTADLAEFVELKEEYAASRHPAASELQQDGSCSSVVSVTGLLSGLGQKHLQVGSPSSGAQGSTFSRPPSWLV